MEAITADQLYRPGMGFIPDACDDAFILFLTGIMSISTSLPFTD